MQTEVFRTFVNAPLDILVIYKDGYGRWLDANENAVSLFNLDLVPDGYIGKNTTEIAKYSAVLWSMIDGSDESDELAWGTGSVVRRQEVFTDRSGNTHSFEFVKIPIFHPNGTRNYLITLGAELTEPMQLKILLEQTQQKFQSLFEHHPDAAFLLDTSGRFVMANSATGAFANELLGKGIDDIPMTNKKATVDKFNAALQGDTRIFDIEITDVVDNKRILSITLVPEVINETITGVFGIAKDVTELVKAQEQMYVDEVTGLPNRRAFFEKLKAYTKAARSGSAPLAVMLINLDGFYNVNNTFNHAIGDAVLAEAAVRIRRVMKNSGFLAHIGGDDFVLIYPTDVGSVKQLAQDILDIIKNDFVVQDNVIHMSASIGFSIFPEAGIRGRELFKNADTACRQAKENGRNQWVQYDSNMSIQAYRQFIFKNDLYKAIKHDQLMVQYQPKVSPISHRIVGAEALIRWEHEDWGIVSPSDFIPIAEENGMISDIGAWVLRTVCSQIRIWDESGLAKVPISVNVSGKQLLKEGFVERVRAIMNEYRVDGSRLEFEFTESVLMRNEHAIVRTVDELHELGIRIALDDFGTGYSSLSQLIKFEFDTVKIDKSFIDDLHVNTDAAKMVKAVIQMAHGLGLTVVVEGVETLQQDEFLRKNECDEIQGYLYSRSVDADEFTELLRKETIQPRIQDIHTHNRRKFYRITLDNPLVADMTIHSIHGNEVVIGTTDVLVHDIGPGGLRFLSHIRMPANNKIILKFNVHIYKEFELFGVVVWTNEIRQDRYEYGVNFSIKESDRDALTQILNQFSIELRHKSVISNCRMWIDSTRSFFKRFK